MRKPKNFIIKTDTILRFLRIKDDIDIDLYNE